MKLLHRTWVLGANLTVVLLMCTNLVQQTQLVHLDGFYLHAFDIIGPATIIVLMLFGILFEVLNLRLAAVVNVGVFAFVGLLALANVYFERRSPHPVERAQVVMLVVLPCMLVAIVNFVLYRVRHIAPPSTRG